MGALGTVFSVAAPIAGGFAQASAARAEAQAQAQAYEYNAQVAENSALSARQAAAADAQQQRRVNAARHGKLIAQIAGQGVRIDEGTPLLIMDEDIAQGELERRKILHKGELEAYNHRNQAALQRYYAAQAHAAGENRARGAITSGLLSGATGLFGGFRG